MRCLFGAALEQLDACLTAAGTRPRAEGCYNVLQMDLSRALHQQPCAYALLVELEV